MNSIIRKNLEILERIVLKNDNKHFNDAFYNDQSLLDQGYKLVNEVKPDFLFQAYVKIPKDKNLDIDIIDYLGYKEYRLKRLFSDLENSIKEEERLSPNLTTFQDVLKEVSNEMVYMFKQPLGENEEIAKHIIEFSRFLKMRYSALIPNHSVLNLKLPNKNLSIGLFQPKSNLKLSFFRELYYVALDHRILDSETSTENDFLDVFTAPQPVCHLTFQCNNFIAVHFLDQISDFFLNFNSSSIGRSTLFLTKQNRPFTESNINASRSRGKGKNIHQKSQIVESISDLKSTILT